MRLFKEYYKYLLVLAVIMVALTLIVGATIAKPSIHEATFQELVEIDQIGYIRADNILLYLKSNPNAEVEDLILVSGIGEKILVDLKRRYK